MPPVSLKLLDPEVHRPVKQCSRLSSLSEHHTPKQNFPFIHSILRITIAQKSKEKKKKYWLGLTELRFSTALSSNDTPMSCFDDVTTMTMTRLGDGNGKEIRSDQSTVKQASDNKRREPRWFHCFPDSLPLSDLIFLGVLFF